MSEFVKLKGDASSREYYRGKNFVKAVYPPSLRDSFYNYLKWYKIYRKQGIPVPEIYDVDTVNLEIIMEDCGDITGVDYFNSLKLNLSKRKFAEEIYSFIGIIQSIPDKEEVETDTLNWEKELIFFKNHCCGTIFSEDFSEFLDNLISFVNENIASIPLKLAHRDYHFRNVMVKNKKIYIIDFQDTLFAPDFYDSASLMFDAYLDLGNLRKIEAKIDEFDYRVVALQRNLKALGTFCFFGFKKNKDWFKDSIPNGLNYVLSHLKILNSGFVKDWEKLREFAFKSI